MSTTSALQITKDNFWKCILIIVRNYHAVNKKIFACKLEDIVKIEEGISEIRKNDGEILPVEEIIHLTSIVLTVSSETEFEETLKKCIENTVDTSEPHFPQGFIVWLKFLNKHRGETIKAVGIVDLTQNNYVCQFLNSTLDDFSIRLTANSELSADILSSRTNVEVSSKWLEDVLKPKLITWSTNDKVKSSAVNSVRSLQLIDAEEYNSLYKSLKKKHSQASLELWSQSKESTDPLKYIYEDLAIAAYLITLWRSTCTHPNAFADLGCGNGLLVYILNEEGYHGYGYDIRSRNIWSHYPKKIQSLLIEETIEPSKIVLPPDVDWLIGNHSDELSPWLPVIAACARFEMRYFLLPCCAYEFSGTKYQRRNSSQSSYTDFLSYVDGISRKCNFVTLTDRLKIPSTKRIALVGIQRTYSQAEFQVQSKAVREFVTQERRGSLEMKFRQKYEIVRNCTGIDKSKLNAIVRRIFDFMLQGTNNDELNNKDSIYSWNSGRRVRIGELVRCLTDDDLKSIKSECGGLKTLLKNKHEIFEFCGHDIVQIRKPKIKTSLLSSKTQHTMKKRMCYFIENHPNGCPLDDSECTFLHASCKK